VIEGEESFVFWSLAAANRRPLPNIKRTYCMRARFAGFSHNTRPHIRARAVFIIYYGKCYSTKKQASVQFVRSDSVRSTVPCAREEETLLLWSREQEDREKGTGTLSAGRDICIIIILWPFILMVAKRLCWGVHFLCVCIFRIRVHY